MTPGTIVRLIKQAEALDDCSETREAVFAVRWIAWEGLRERILIIAAAKAGWRIADASAAIAEARISSNIAFERTLKKLTGFGVSQQFGGDSIKAWRALAEVEQLRHLVFHGRQGLPLRVWRGANQVVRAALHGGEEWFGTVEVRGPDGGLRTLGNPMALRPPGVRWGVQSRLRSELASILGVAPKSGGYVAVTAAQVVRWNSL